MDSISSIGGSGAAVSVQRLAAVRSASPDAQALASVASPTRDTVVISPEALALLESEQSSELPGT